MKTDYLFTIWLKIKKKQFCKYFEKSKESTNIKKITRLL